MQTNAKQTFADIVKPLVTLLKNVGRRVTNRNSTSRNYAPSAPGTYTVQSSPNAYTVTSQQYAPSDFSGSLQYDSSSRPSSSSQSASPASLTPDMVNQMIINALASMNILGTDSSLSHTWYLDSRASNHMTSSPTNEQKHWYSYYLDCKWRPSSHHLCW